MKKFTHLFLTTALALVWANFSSPSFCFAQEYSQNSIRERIKEKVGRRSSEGESKTGGARLSEPGYISAKISGRNVSIWESHLPGPSALLLFSHGFKGCSTQSKSIMTVLANSGFTVVAPVHADASCSEKKPDKKMGPGFRNPEEWNEDTFKDRRDDIISVLDGLKVDPIWSKKLDFNRVSLVGHSLGGYTVLALAGAWPSWKLQNVKAVLAWSPYAQPFVTRRTIGKIDIPIMFQGGTRDFGITPFIKKPEGAYDQARSPAYFVDFQDAGHFSWTDINKKQIEVIVKFSLSFLKRYALDDLTANPAATQAGVAEIRSK